MTSPIVSVIVPAYGHRDYVLETLNSVFAQSFNDFEVIVVNDGSPDDTAQVLKPLRDTKRIRYFEQPNGGQASARNRGLAEARGAYIAFLDDDDLWPRNKLAWQVSVLRKHPDLNMIAGNSAFFHHAPSSFRARKAPTFVVTFESLFLRNPISSPGQTLIRASALKTLGGFNAEIWGADDLDLWMRLSRIGKIQMHSRIALLYRCHPGNASKARARMLRNHAEVLRRNIDFVDAPERKVIERRAYLSLYDYLGRQVVGAVKLYIKRGQLIRAANTLLCLRVFLRRPPLNFNLTLKIARDFLPWGLVARCKRCIPDGLPKGNYVPLPTDNMKWGFGKSSEKRNDVRL